MSDIPDMATNPQSDAAPAAPVIRVLNQYIKDLSFENPGASVSEQPNIELSIDVAANPQNVEEGMIEVVLNLKARAGTTETTLFILELDYAGMFQITNVQDKIFEQIVLIECPRILFPFARRIISDVSAEGGFPPLRIDPVDFAALYQNQLQRAQEKPSEPAAEA